ncbi:MAG TPA: hypothetical protein VEL07_11715 [Planctomycetota bacterium]|nr:hypothetical protein [Planctomycetota bacterium]
MKSPVRHFACHVLLIACAAAAEDPVAAGGFATGLTLGDGGWSAPATIDERACRELVGQGVVALPVWWGDGMRPPAGQAFRIEVDFRDTASSPIRVEVFAGLPGRYELHRIGGLGDGAWRTALIPLPADMVMRLPGRDHTELVFSAPAGGPVAFADLRIVAGDPVADEARWCAETRAWVARAQAVQRAALTASETAQAPVLPGASTHGAIAFVRPCWDPIRPVSAPQAGEVGAPLRLTLARNEIESGQFGVHAHGMALSDVAIALIAAPRRDDGLTLGAEVELLTAEFAAVHEDGHEGRRLAPQRLWPSHPVAIAPGRSHAFWLTVAGDRTRPEPGVYHAEVAVTAGGEAVAALRVEIVVAPLDLIGMDEAGLAMGGCVAGAVPRHEMAAMRRQNHNSINFWYSGFAPAIQRISATEFTLDFRILDEVMRDARESGITSVVWFLGGDPYGFPDTLHLERELYRCVVTGDGGMEGRKEYLRRAMAAPDALLPELRDLYRDWVAQVTAHARAADWPELILTPYDEPAKWTQDRNHAKLLYYRDATGYEHIAKPRREDIAKTIDRLTREGIPFEELGTGGAGRWHKPHFEESCALIRAGDPDVRIYGSIHHGTDGLPFLDDIDVFCTNMIQENEALGDIVRAAQPVAPSTRAKAFWQYAGMQDALNARWEFGFRFARYDSRGSLCWAYNFANDRFDTSGGGAWIYAWTTPYAVVRSPSYEALREAWDDRRYIETVRARARSAGPAEVAEAEAFLATLFAEAAAAQTDRGAAIEHCRARLRDRLLAGP